MWPRCPNTFGATWPIIPNYNFFNKVMKWQTVVSIIVVWDGVQINVMSPNGHIIHASLIQNPDFQSLTQWRKHLLKHHLLVPYWFCCALLSRRPALSIRKENECRKEISEESYTALAITTLTQGNKQTKTTKTQVVHTGRVLALKSARRRASNEKELNARDAWHLNLSNFLDIASNAEKEPTWTKNYLYIYKSFICYIFVFVLLKMTCCCMEEDRLRNDFWFFVA